LRLSRLPNFKYFGDKLKKKDISDDDLVRSFLIVALATFLCPNSNTYPSTKHLLPLVDIKNAKDWDWSKYVHFWLMEDIRKYQRNMMSSTHDSITLGGCLYVLCVSVPVIVFLVDFFVSSSCLYFMRSIVVD